MIPKETIDEIFQTARVEEVIGEFVHLKRAGSNYKAKSPFTDEKTPSFMVSPAKQIWKCFSTGKGGNVVTFLMEHEHFNYVEALKWLANKYGIEVKEDRERTPEEIEATNVRENLSVINEFARDTFVYNMNQTEEGKSIGKSYFTERGFREDTIEKFQLGYCLDESDAFTKLALSKGYKLEYLAKAGLTKDMGDRQFDFFKGRVMFPIHSVAGKVLGFGGRTLKKDKKVAKYFNSPESELYNKSEILYGLYFAKNNIIKYDRCYLVEGYTDVISLHQSGIENVVASSGTALTVGQIRLIKRYTDNITILYDGDAAGIRASFRGIDLILEEGMNVKVILFPDGEDPDSFAQKSSSSELETYLEENAKDFIVFKSDVLLKEANNDPIKRAELVNDVVQSIGVIPDAIKRQVYLREAANIFGIEEEIIAQEVAKKRREKVARDTGRPEIREIPVAPIEKKPQPTVVIDKIYPQELDIIRILLSYGTNYVVTETVEESEQGKKVVPIKVSVIELIIHELDRDEITLENEYFRIIYDEFKSGLSENVLYGESHFVTHQNHEVAKIAANIIGNRHEASPNWWVEKKVKIESESDKLDRAVIEAIYSYKNARVAKEIEMLQKDIRALSEVDSDESHEEIMMLLAKQKKLDRVKLLISEKLGRIII